MAEPNTALEDIHDNWKMTKTYNFGACLVRSFHESAFNAYSGWSNLANAPSQYHRLFCRSGAQEICHTGRGSLGLEVEALRCGQDLWESPPWQSVRMLEQPRLRNATIYTRAVEHSLRFPGSTWSDWTPYNVKVCVT